MDLSNPNELQMIYMCLSQTPQGLVFSVDGKEEPLQTLRKKIEDVVGFVSHFSYKPIIAKLEVLDPKEYYVMSLTLPIMPAFLDVKDLDDINLLTDPNYLKIMKSKATSLRNGEFQTLITNRTNEYVNYIQHELAGAYINCMLNNKPELAAHIQNLPILNSFDISNFSHSKAGRIVYKTPQFLRYRTTLNGEPYFRQYYMGLQENVQESAKTPEFWDTVAKRDMDYVTLDESMNATLAKITELSIDGIDFVGPNASSNYTEPPQKS